MIGITESVIDPRALEAAVARPEAGAILTFSGVTRNNFDGRPVLGLRYEAYADMAVPEMERIAAEAMQRWPGVRVAMVHRVGALDIGEASVVIAVSAPHRDAAYQAGRFAIDALKERVPVWKKELYADGEAWKANAESPVQPGGVALEEPPGCAGQAGPGATGRSGASTERAAPAPPAAGSAAAGSAAAGPGGAEGGARADDGVDLDEIGRTFGGPGVEGAPPRFRTRRLDSYPRPDLNPYLELHQRLKPEVITSEEGPGYRGRWHEAFGRRAPLHVEIGPGNGFFLAGMGARHPERNWLGIELRFKRVVLTARKLRRAGVRHGRVLRYDARYLDDLFEREEIDGLYINHPDPWARKRDAKHRLLSRPFAEWIVRSLRPGGRVRIKTDFHPNLDLFEELLVGLPLQVTARVDDVFRDGSPWGADDVETNYQGKFRARGEPVAAMELLRG